MLPHLCAGDGEDVAHKPVYQGQTYSQTAPPERKERGIAGDDSRLHVGGEEGWG